MQNPRSMNEAPPPYDARLENIERAATTALRNILTLMTAYPDRYRSTDLKGTTDLLTEALGLDNVILDVPVRRDGAVVESRQKWGSNIIRRETAKGQRFYVSRLPEFAGDCYGWTPMRDKALTLTDSETEQFYRIMYASGCTMGGVTFERQSDAGARTPSPCSAPPAVVDHAWACACGQRFVDRASLAAHRGEA